MQARDREDDTSEPEGVERAAHAEGLDAPAVPRECSERLAGVLSRVPDEVDEEEHDDHQKPREPEPERPREGDALQISEEERRISERGQHAADGRDQEHEEDHVCVTCRRSLLVRRRGRISSIEAPVVPMKDASTLPSPRKAALVSGVAMRSPRSRIRRR